MAEHDGDLDLTAIVEQRKEAIGGTVVGFSFGTPPKRFTMPHPAFATDEWNDELTDITGTVDQAIFCLGEEQYAEFKEAGGEASFIVFLLDELNKRQQAVDGRGRPTRPGASSREQRRRQKRT